MAKRKVKQQRKAAAKPRMRKQRRGQTKATPHAGIGIRLGVRGALGRMDDMNPFPPQLFCKLAYSDVYTLSTSNLTNTCGAVQAMNLNSLYDPDKTGGGHQPYGFDQLCAAAGPYARYKVSGALVEARFENAPSTNMTLCAMVHNVTDTTTLAGQTLGTIKERPNTWTKYMSTTGQNTILFKQFIPMHTLFEWTNRQYKDDMGNSTGAYNGSPGNTPYIEFGVLDLRSGATSNCYLEVRVIYYAMFYERITLGPS